MHESLPTPSEDAQRHSLRLQNAIKEKIRTNGKISFHDFMQMSLYEPGLGYYSAGSAKFGRNGDFITAPELSPLFGMSIAKKLMAFLRHAKNPHWFELGAGTGKLAASILRYLEIEQNIPDHYYILEVSADLKERQRTYLQKNLSQECYQAITWLDELPESFRGIIIANEVLDALAVHRFTINAQGIWTHYLRLNHQEHFEHFLDEPNIPDIAQRIAALKLTTPYTSEINLQQEGLIRSLSRILTEGLLLFIDYGFPQHEFYHPERHLGTLMCHYQHRAHDDVLFWPGLQDITAHIDFTALAHCALNNGLSLAHFTTQTAWLLEAGILTLAEKIAKTLSDTEQLRQQKILNTLIGTEEMGELFKFIMFTKNITLEEPISSRRDMRHRL